MPKKWNLESVIGEILDHHQNGHKLNSLYAQIHYCPLYQAACIYCGSWRKAIEAAGLSYDDVRVLQRNHPVWSKTKIIAIIRHKHCHGSPLNSNHIQTKESRLYAAALTYFGSWSGAISAADLNYSEICKVTLRSWSKATVVAAIQQRRQNNLSIGGGDVSLEDRGLYQAAMRHFGKHGWTRARVLAGFNPIDPRPWQIWDEHSVSTELRRLYESGVALNTASLRHSSHAYILSAACNVHGSFAKAIKATGLDYSKIRKMRSPGWWTKLRVLMCIRSLQKQGVRLSHNAIHKNHGPLFSSAVVHFGSWSQAVEAADIPYRSHCRVWSTKAWLRRMKEHEYISTLERAQTNAKKRRT